MTGSNGGNGDDGSDGAAERDRDGERVDEGRTEADGAGPGGGESNAIGRSDDDVTIEDDGVVRWLLRSDDGNVVFVRDVLGSVAIVAAIGLILFGVSGVWPPLVAVESGSMEPNMQKGDLVFVVEDDRFVGDDPSEDTGVVTLENGRESGHEKFGNPGDVIVFQPDGNDRETPIIHRAHFWVEKNEDWIDTKADEEIVGDLTCEDVASCPADHAGFVTKGDANPTYDQLASSRTGRTRTDVVRPEWITGKAMFRVPWLGHVRLTFDRILGGMLVSSPSTSPGSGTVLEGPTGPVTPDVPAASAGLAGATGLATVGGAAVTVIGRKRY